MLWGDRDFSVFAALVYLTTGDVLFYNGWLAYSDPLFAFFVLASMLMGWLAVEKRRNTYLAISLLALSCAFLTKVATAYVFYAVALTIVAYRRRTWKFLFSRASLGMHVAAIVVPILWYTAAPEGNWMCPVDGCQGFGQNADRELAELPLETHLFSFPDIFAIFAHRRSPAICQATLPVTVRAA